MSPSNNSTGSYAPNEVGETDEERFPLATELIEQAKKRNVVFSPLSVPVAVLGLIGVSAAMFFFNLSPLSIVALYVALLVAVVVTIWYGVLVRKEEVDRIVRFRTLALEGYQIDTEDYIEKATEIVTVTFFKQDPVPLVETVSLKREHALPLLEKVLEHQTEDFEEEESKKDSSES